MSYGRSYKWKEILLLQEEKSDVSTSLWYIPIMVMKYGKKLRRRFI